jgi:2,3-bisphosphoglycerate-dependent phosphoglycerate mutase
MRLYIIRHAQSTNNALDNQQHRVQDPGLTQLGERQAELLARHLATGIELIPALYRAEEGVQSGYGISRLYCSPMWRSLQTAQPVGKVLRLQPHVWTDIHEEGGIYLDAGDGSGRVGYPGKSRQEIEAAYPSFVLPDDITECGWWNRGFEEKDVFHARARRVAEKLREWAPTDERIALITHGGFTNALLKALFDNLPNPHIFYQHHNTAITRLNFRDDGFIDIQYVNRVDYLPPDMVS